jgi:hypothetical protein
MSATLFAFSPFRATRGSHSPQAVRDCFAQAVEAWLHWDSGQPVPTVELRGQQIGIELVCGLTWNYADTMPRSLCGDLEIGAGSTYAQGARALKARIKRAAADRQPAAF